MKYIVYNPQCNNKKGEEHAYALKEKLVNAEVADATGLNYKQFLTYLSADDEVYLVGGDGTISRLINELEDAEIQAKLYCYPSGTGNDFAMDVNYGKEKTEEFILLNDYIKNLPTVTVNGMTKKFINGVGFGLDGMCCQIGDEKRENNVKNINYASIAVNQLLFKFRKKKATVTVDGKKYEFDNVWIAPTMKGRFYGGGMMVAPAQDRFNPDKNVTTVLFFGKSRLATLIVFPKIFKGEHVNHKKRVATLTGKEITVEFNEPTALQIDGETVKNVKFYTVKA